MLELKNICYEIREAVGAPAKAILRDINLTVADRDFLAITGPNGGGKSTLAKLIMGIETPTQGRILLDGQDITDLGISERARLGLGFAFQQPVRFKGLTVLDLLSLAAGQTLETSKACGYLAEVGLSAKDYLSRELNSSLSGGELKRIEIAMQIVRSPKLSIFDEPEAGIDLWSFQNLIRVFEKMREEIKGSVLVISHQERILNIADRIVVIADGQITTAGDREDILPKLLPTVETCDLCGSLEYE